MGTCIRTMVVRGHWFLIGIAGFSVASLEAAPLVPDWRPALLVPREGYFSPDGEIQIQLPELSDQELQNLALELDNVDVSSLVDMKGNFVSIIPPQSLSWGEHTLRLIEYGQDDSVIERGAWTIEARKSAQYREAAAQSDITLNGVYRLNEDGEQISLPGRGQSNGAASFQGALADADWELRGNGNLLYDTQVQRMPGHEQEIDLGQYLISYKNSSLSVNVGHQKIVPESLIMQGFNRRGVSIGVKAADDSAMLTGFALRPDNVVGFRNGFGISDSTNRIDGVVTTYQPIHDAQSSVLLTATHLTGAGSSQIGVATGGDTIYGAGSASSVSVDASLLADSLSLHAEYAKTAFDFTGSGTSDYLEHDHAYMASANYIPWRDMMLDGQPLLVSIGLQRSRVGTFFRSIANLAGVSDRDGILGTFGATWGGLQALVNVGRETDNVNDVSILPRSQFSRNGVTLNYTPAIPALQTEQSEPNLPWYGHPTYSLAYANVNQGISQASATQPVGAVHDTKNWVAAATFAYLQSYWSITQTIGEDTDLSHVSPSTKIQQTQLSASLRVNDKFTIAPSLQIIQNENIDDPNKGVDTTGITLNTSYLFTNTITSSISFTYNHNRVIDGGYDFASTDVIGSVNWLAQPGRGAQPSITFGFEGLVHRTDDGVDHANDVNNYQLNFKMTVGMQPRF